MDMAKNHGGNVWISAVWKRLLWGVKYAPLDLSCEAFSAATSA